MGRKNRREEIYIRPLTVIRRELQHKPKRMDIWFAGLPFNYGSNVQGGNRPVLIVSNDINNASSKTVTVIPLTSKMKRPELPTHVWMDMEFMNGMDSGSMLLAEQITTIDKSCLIKRLGYCTNPELVEKVESAMKEQLFGGSLT